MFIRYNNTAKYYEYDTSAGQTGAGPWVILPIDKTQIYNLPAGGNVSGPASAVDQNIATFQGTTGKLIEDRGISVNVLARRDTFNDFVNAGIRVRGGSGTGYDTPNIEVYGTATPRISFHWPGVVAAQIGMNSAGIISAMDAGGTGYAAFRSANHYEGTRGTPLGYWIDIPFNSAYFGGEAGWTPSVNYNRYALVGKTVFWEVSCSGYCPACNYLWIQNPNVQFKNNSYGGFLTNNPGWSLGIWQAAGSQSTVYLRSNTYGAFNAGGTDCHMTVIAEIN